MLTRTFAAHPEALRAALRSGVSTCRDHAAAHPGLTSVADVLGAIERRVAGEPGTAPDLAAVAAALKITAESAPSQTRDHLAPVADMLRSLLDEQAYLAAPECMVVPREAT